MEFALGIIAKSTLLLLLTTLVLTLFRRTSAGFRHWLISWSMIMLLALPFLGACLPGWQIRVLPVKQGAILQEKPGLSAPIAAASVEAKDQIIMPTVANQITPMPETDITAPVKLKRFSISWGQILCTFWVLGVFGLLLRMVSGLFHLRQLRKQAFLFFPETDLDQIPIPVMIKAPKNLRILYHPKISTPLTWSSLTPIILLPAKAVHWSREELEMILLHELVHIRRQDFLVHLISLLTVSLYWYHPLIWWLNKQQLLEREKACDEAVIRTGVRPVDYAEKLLAIARKLVPEPKYRGGLAIQMAQVSLIKKRIVAILQNPSAGSAFSKKGKWILVAVLLLTLPFLAAVEPVTLPVIDHFPIRQVFGSTNIQGSERSGKDLEDLPTSASFIIDQEHELPLRSVLPTVVASALPSLPELPDNYSQSVSSREANQLEFQPRKMTQIQGLYGSWQNDRSKFQVWIKGNLRLLPIMPFIEAESPDDLIVIEEKRGAKTYRLVISKAPVDGALLQSFRNGRPNSWSEISAGENLYLWTINNDWVFLAKGLDKWMEANLNDIAEKLMDTQSSIWQTANEQNSLWKNLIESQEQFKAERFVPGTELPTWNNQQDKIVAPSLNPPKEMFDLSSLPYFPASGILGRSTIKKIGFDTATKVTTGWSGSSNPGNTRYATLISSRGQAGRLVDFNFHLRYNMCRNADLLLHIYAVENGQPSFNLLAEPIQIETGDETGWISTDLRPYALDAAEDMLVIMELTNFQPNAKGGGLFFSHAPGGDSNFDQLSKDFAWDFRLVPLAAYFEVE